MLLIYCFLVAHHKGKGKGKGKGKVHPITDTKAQKGSRVKALLFL